MKSVIKYFSLPIILVAILCMLFSCSKAAVIIDGNPSDTIRQDTLHRNILIVYLSRTNNTKVIAEMIQRHVGGKLVSLELTTPYPANYQVTVQQVENENESGYLPPLKTKIDSIEKYNIVFIGTPTWGMRLPPPMKSFLHQYNLAGKTVIPFNTNGGYGAGSCFQTIKDLCPNSTVLDGFSTRGGLEGQGILLYITGDREKDADTGVTEWLKTIKMQ